MTLSNEDIFYIPGVHEIIMSYKEDMDVILKRIEIRRKQRLEHINWKASVKHIRRMAKSRMYK